MKTPEKDMVHKALKCCRIDGSCEKCPFRTDVDCIDILEHELANLYIAEHPEILNGKKRKK